MQGWCDSVRRTKYTHQTLFVRPNFSRTGFESVVRRPSRIVWDIRRAIQQTTCRKSLIVTDKVWVVIIIVPEETTSARCAPAHPPIKYTSFFKKADLNKNIINEKKCEKKVNTDKFV